MFKLKYAVQNYAWGNYGEDSEVYKLLVANGAANADIKLPYAELWLGTHVSGPSIVESTNTKLMDQIIDNYRMLGTGILGQFGVTLPFLMKVLSVRTALSIQVHPNKKEAEYLHRIAPDVYKDDNHKPELAIALTKFEALVGFRPLEEITLFLKSIPQLGELIGSVMKEYLDLISKKEKLAALKLCYKTLMHTDVAHVQKTITSLVSDFESGKVEEYLTAKYSHLAELFLRLNSQYPNDIGCFSLFLLNDVVLAPGEAIFLSANLPHAYISGTIIECMASSDNVIRAGLTPKPKDIDTLLSMLNYESCAPDHVKFAPVRLPSADQCIVRDLFAPPVDDFAVERIEVGVRSTMSPLGDLYTSASLILVIVGNGVFSVVADGQVGQPQSYERGNAFFVSANVVVNITASSATVLFRALANTDH